MAKTPTEKGLRDLRVSAMSGDHASAKVLLKMYGHGKIALEIRAKRPFTNRVKRTVDFLTAGTNSHWEWTDARGEIHNDLQGPPPPKGGKGRPPRRRIILDD
jgi:hypothetical protein